MSTEKNASTKGEHGRPEEVGSATTSIASTEA
jgi:hypothetical protein